MLTIENKKEYYQALLAKKTEYEGVFFVGVKTTGVFCRPTCPARKPKLSTGYESSSGFRDAFSRIMGAAPTKLGSGNILKAAWLDTPLGPMLAIADEAALYL